MIRKCILIADDCATTLNALAHRIRAAGYEVHTATDGSEAVALAGRIRPDVVIVDVNFPPDISQGGVDWDGFRILEWMNRTGSVGLAPCIIITSDDVETHHQAAVASGATAIFQKPISISVLLETLRECLEQPA